MEFTYDAYTIMISELRRHGYQFADYRDHDKYDKCVILRHDVDYSLEKAYQLAALEYKLNVHSTYMILVSSGFYNIISKQTQEILKDILKMGHHIGLHFDEANYNTQDMNALKEYALEEVEVLKRWTGTDVAVISMHRPSTACLDADWDFSNQGIVNSYGKLFFKGFKYVSDSRMFWREPVMDYIKSDKFNRLHILTHAFWYNDAIESIQQKLEMFLQGSYKDRYNLLDNNFRNLEEYHLEKNKLD